MNFETKHLDDFTIFQLKEKKLDANISGLVKAEVTLLVKGEGDTNLIIDLNDVEACDSSGLSALLVANRLINAVGGKLAIITSSEKILSLIRITQLHRVLFICADVDAAIKEFNNP
ncbi:MAG: anti-sigma factor antagonist [Ignavibacteria bacterium CG_4_8_14_3_um_filter_37_9]|nr:STAS domain-containing protein [Ignavibacteria bacterium]OIO23197.1 MAG: anti-anti-sigma factor [Ignavibacteria bacterium CG1_02_37_35]PIP76966.1 MAG: anti-anti-sigma factor [Ignavibacteria bacterium CG22_combo_CG10-13_8_21_14_all_37_15]PIS44345.1 MAG: anti-sigma factor antagonist [Ignavibacteria bacterium CG08_land_8_20_14_0_20_37_9]PIW97994.1 MAG: anti-sigma factor antagonist [Ignavibacteria bacterium CG_4_8_14_3_um_filter_37_9]PIX95037.1 MAG: anti-sigma factor antagonist [Ignavibacteria 